jgi:hypothetical protein
LAGKQAFFARNQAFKNTKNTTARDQHDGVLDFVLAQKPAFDASHEIWTGKE